jgi:hypothetical protein
MMPFVLDCAMDRFAPLRAMLPEPATKFPLCGSGGAAVAHGSHTASAQSNEKTSEHRRFKRNGGETGVWE